MIRKNGPLDFDVNAYTSSSITTNINFWTQDRQTARLVFKLSKDGVPLPLAAVTGKLVLVMSDGSRFIRDVTIVDRVNGHAEYILSDKEIKHYGIVQAELSLYYANNQSMSVHQFSFQISKSLIDQDIVPITEYYVDEFEALRVKINELYDEAILTIDELNAKFEDLEKIETKQGAQAKVDAALLAAKKYTDEHAETPEGAQLKADAALEASKKYVDPHIENKKIHVTESEKSSWNKGQLYRLTQNNGKPIYKGVSETTDYNEITDTGLYLIYNKGLNAPQFIDGAFMIVVSYKTTLLQTIYDTAGRNSYYRIKKTDSSWTEWTRVLTEEDKVTEAEKDKWNNSQLYKLTTDLGTSQLLPNGTDILTLPSGYYYAVGTNVVNMPSKTDSSWFNIYVFDNSNNRKTLHVIRSADNKHWWGTTHTDGSFRGWKRMLTDDDSISTWNQVTLVAGTVKQFAGNPLKFSIRLNTLHLRGSFEGIPANDTIIARFAQKPSAKTVFVGATVGSYGSARFTLDTDGSLRFDGMSANDNSYVSRFEINESIPLW
ncbi:BppU family phage baseplate upper protein [Bacillus sp. A015]